MANKRTTEENLRLAYEILAGIPVNRFTDHLEAWYWNPEPPLFERGGLAMPDPRHCGTLACGAGWLSLHPTFKREIDQDWEAWCSLHFGSQSMLARLFGARDHRASHEWMDEKMYGELSSYRALVMTDKQILLYRIRREIRQSAEQAYEGAVTDGREMTR